MAQLTFVNPSVSPPCAVRSEVPRQALQRVLKALFDHRLLLNGSYNWTRSAANRNQENFLVTGEPRFVEDFARQFERLWEKFS